MRVLHVMEATIGGTRRHLVDVARGQHQAGLDVHLAVATSRDPDFPADLDALQAEGVSVTRLPMVRSVRPWRDWRDYRALVRLMREVRPDVVHTHSSKAGVLGRRASLASGVGARVHTPHTFAFLFEELFGALTRRLYRTVESRLARRTERIIAVSESEAETFRSSGVVPLDRIRVVPNGIQASRFESAKPVDLACLGLDPGKPVAAVIGLVYSGKGQDLALEALTGQGCSELQLLVVGPGDTTSLEARARELDVAERVRFTGPRRDVPELLAALDFLILPSRWEGMPYVVLEAMASGVPVLATPVDGARELVSQETGWLARSISADALAEGARALLEMSDSKRADLGRAGRERVAESYTIERMVQGLVEVYSEVCGELT